MAKFDESKVINALHVDKAEIGKKYYFGDVLYNLKHNVENEDVSRIGELTNVINGETPFHKNNNNYWEYIYPYEEPPKQRMTNRQLAEWLAKGNGEQSSNGLFGIYTTIGFAKDEECNEVPSDYVIRSWGSDEWVTPTVDIYERDCK